MDRRRFLSSFAQTLTGTLATCGFAAVADDTGQAVSIQLKIDLGLARSVIPPDFLGLAFEISSVATPGLLSRRNTPYVQYVRTLGPAGVIRIGGNTLDYSTFSAHAKAVPATKATVVNEAAIDDLAGFLEATGWKLIWGLDLGRGTEQQAVEEAEVVAAKTKDRLLAFEIGNEPDFFAGKHRPQSYEYEQWHAEYRRYRDAIRAKLPNASMAGPDVLRQTDWVTRFAEDEGKDIKLLTHHYYAEGPPEDPAATIENLLERQERLTQILAQCRSASRSANVPYRVCETNSCFHGGKRGVSDAFASALWGLDFLFMLAAADGVGANFETGVNHLGFISPYSPIGDDEHGNYSAKPLYYGLLAFALASQGRLVEVQYDPGNMNVKAYAVLGEDKRVSVTLINKEASRGVKVAIACPGPIRNANLLRLTAPSLESKSEVTLGGSGVSAVGQWKANRRERVSVRSGQCVVSIPAASAALVRLEQG